MRAILLAAILLAAGTLRFRSLDWHEYGLPHPDERAVASETHDMLERDDYRPRIHSWGHLAFYSALFSYKGFLVGQHWANGTPIEPGESLFSVAGSRVPHFRDLVRSGAHLPVALLGIVALWIAGEVAHRVHRRHPRWTWLLVAVLGVLLVLLMPRLRALMLTPVIPDYDDVTYVGRFLSATYSTLSVALVYAIGSRLYSSTVGLVGAAFLAVAVLPIQQAHFFTVDNLQAFCVLLALWLAAIALRVPATEGDRLREGESGASPVSALDRFAVLRQRLRHQLAWPLPLLYILLGGAVGMAMASKFSSAPLLIVPLVLHLFVLHRLRSSSHLALHTSLVLAYVAVLGSWYHLEPSAWENPFLPFAEAEGLGDLGERWLHILFAQDFARQIFDESRMVQGTGGGPWAQQFAHTTPFVTMTLQMVRWSLGWPLGLVCVGGFVWVTARNLLQPRAADLLLLSWTLSSFLILGTFKATFPRYTVAVVPLIALFGAVITVGRDAVGRGAARGRLRSRLGMAIALLAIGCGLLYSVAYFRVLDRPHSWTTASLWILKNIPPTQPDGSATVIAHEEWDDEIPLDIASHENQYGTTLMNPYTADDEQQEKAELLAGVLEEADWICLPSTRLYGTILGVSERYPITTRYYQSLFAGALGFTLRRTVREAPGLRGWRLDDLLADESHHVYDHPKAVIFEKTQVLSRQELVDRILDPPAPANALTRAQILHWRETAREQLDNLWRDPYNELGVLTPSELETLLDVVVLEASQRSDFLEAASHLGTEPSVAVAEVAALVRDVVAIDDRSLADLGDRIAALPSAPAYRVEDVTRLLRGGRLLSDPESEASLRNRVSAFVDGERVARAEVLAKLEAVDLGAGILPPVSTSPATPGAMLHMASEGGGRAAGLWEALKWILALEALGIAALPLCLGLFRSLPDAGYPLAKTFGLVLGAYLVWITVNLGWAPFVPALSIASLVVLAAGAWALPSRAGR